MEWHLVEMVTAEGVESVPAEWRATILFEDGRAAGRGGCNRFMGDATIDGSNLTFGPLATTMMACPPELMELERVYLVLLDRVVSYELDGVRLSLTDADGNRLLGFVRSEAASYDRGVEQHTFRRTEAAEAARAEPYEPYHVVFERGELELGYYTPEDVDDQEPHARDEVYVIVSGSGKFLNGESITEFGPGDALFVPAGVEHRFIEFTDALEMWVMFYGPEGGS